MDKNIRGRTAREELIVLRISVARMAQSFGVDNHLHITEGSYEWLYKVANERELGWNDLVGRCTEQLTIERLRNHVDC